MRSGTFQRPRRSNPLMMASSNVDGAGLQGPPLRGRGHGAGQVGADPVEFLVRLSGIRPGQTILVVAHRKLTLGGGIGEQLRHLDSIGVRSGLRAVSRHWSAHQ